jgi:hypothetical protein
VNRLSFPHRLLDALLDPQGARFYAWEFDLEVAHQSPLPFSKRAVGSPFAPALSLQQCTAYAQKVFTLYGARVLPIVPARPDQALYAWSNRHQIGLPPLGRNYFTILHEVAHSLCSQFALGREHDSGFVRLYLELLAVFLDLDFLALVASARSSGLSVAAYPSPCPA